jgi:hypothetical protein
VRARGQSPNPSNHASLYLVVRCMVRITLVLTPIVLAAATLTSGGHIALAADSPDSATRNLTPEAVSSLVKAELRHRGLENKFSARAPQYISDKRQWWVFLIQAKPPFVVDGDMLAVVNDATEKVCIDQAMVPPGLCT